MAATDFIWTAYPIPGADISCKNTGNTSNFALGDLVQLDGTNYLGSALGGVQTSIGVKDGTANCVPFGYVVETILFNGSAAAGGVGRIRTYGIAQATASGAITAGAVVGGAASKQTVTYTAANPQSGMAVSTTVNAADPMLVSIHIANNH